MGKVGQAPSPASIDDSSAQVFHRRVFVGKSCIARTHLKTWLWVPASSLPVGMTLEKVRVLSQGTARWLGHISPGMGCCLVPKADLQEGAVGLCRA